MLAQDVHGLRGHLQQRVVLVVVIQCFYGHEDIPCGISPIDGIIRADASQPATTMLAVCEETGEKHYEE
jgi:hypothetical protein